VAQPLFGRQQLLRSNFAASSKEAKFQLIKDLIEAYSTLQDSFVPEYARGISWANWWLVT
jgi:hypothetical protein